MPGHGEVLERDRALAILREDRAYLEGLGTPGDTPLPLARRTVAQKAIHVENLQRL